LNLEDLCRNQQLPYTREDSFKLLHRSGLITGRYVLGIACRHISLEKLLPILDAMGYPIKSNGDRAHLQRELLQCSTIFLGEEQHSSGSSYRLYFEYWDAIKQKLSRTSATEIIGWVDLEEPSWPMMTGYKWLPAEQGTCCNLNTTYYQVRPLLTPPQIQTRIENRLRAWPGFAGHLAELILAATTTIMNSDRSIQPVFLTVHEPMNPRTSFDLCTHRYNLRLETMRSTLEPLIQWLMGASCNLKDCLNGGSSAAWLTHLSAGLDRSGEPFVTLYYDASD
jgi:hypothetical protein